MKKIIAMSLIAAAVLSFAACSDDKTAPAETETKAAVSTIFITASDPEPSPVSISMEEINDLIDSVKKEYADVTQMTLLEDGSVISAEVKDPGITLDNVTSGTATAEQMNAYITYIANIRRIVCDRLVSYFPEENKVVINDSDDATKDFLFLDPVSDEFESASDAFAKISSTNTNGKIVTDYIIVQNSTALLFDSETNAPMLLCPSEDENALLTAVVQKLDPGALTEADVSE